VSDSVAVGRRRQVAERSASRNRTGVATG